MQRAFDPILKLREDLCRLARFGANLADAHSCFIFLPGHFLSESHSISESHSVSEKHSISDDKFVHLAGFHSLSNDIIKDCRVPNGNGLVGWVAKHHRSIHVSPFEHDSRTLGMYAVDQALKSFIGIPVVLSDSTEDSMNLCGGVLACDSRKSFAFSKLHGKLLEDLSREISNTLLLIEHYCKTTLGQVSWVTFTKRATELGQALGNNCVDVLRLRLSNFDELEGKLGTRRTVEALEQIQRLIHQALPPHFPHLRLPNGDILIALDNMMTAFYENKIRVICEHRGFEGQKLSFDFVRSSGQQKRSNSKAIEDLVVQTSGSNTKRSNIGNLGESFKLQRAQNV